MVSLYYIFVYRAETNERKIPPEKVREDKKKQNKTKRLSHVKLI